MRRRNFIAGLASATAAWPVTARAQQPAANVPVITLINARRADAGGALAAEFRKGLSQTGFTEGKDVLVEYHWLDGHYEEIPEILNDAIRRHAAVIATPGNTPATLAAKAATSTIPIGRRRCQSSAPIRGRISRARTRRYRVGGLLDFGNAVTIKWHRADRIHHRPRSGRRGFRQEFVATRRQCDRLHAVRIQFERQMA
jgi:hypothetical protein